MQLCECFRLYGDCSKRKIDKPGLFDPCEWFERPKEMSQNGYESLKAQLLHLRQERDAAQEASREARQPIYRINVPMEVSGKDVASDLSGGFLFDSVRADLDDDEQFEALFKRASPGCVFYLPGYYSENRSGRASIETEMRRDLRAVQEDIRRMADRWNRSQDNFGITHIPPDWGEPGDREDVVARTYSKAFGSESGV